LSGVDVRFDDSGEVVSYSLNGKPRPLSDAEFEGRMEWLAAGLTPKKNGKGTRRVLATAAVDVERAQAEWLDGCRVPLGKVTIVAGPGGVGKSQWTCLLAGQLSRGELGEAAASLIATAEDDPSTTVRPRLEAVQADLARVHFLTIATSEGDEDGIEIPDDLPQLEQTVRDLGACSSSTRWLHTYPRRSTHTGTSRSGARWRRSTGWPRTPIAPSSLFST
jgi:AAA domain